MNLISEDNLYNLNQVGEVNHDTAVEFSQATLELSRNSGAQFAEKFQVSLQCSEGQIDSGISDMRLTIHWQRGRYVPEQRRDPA